MIGKIEMERDGLGRRGLMTLFETGKIIGMLMAQESIHNEHEFEVASTCACVRVCETERERKGGGDTENQRDGEKGEKEEKPVAVFWECVKQICQRDAQGVDYAWE